MSDVQQEAMQIEAEAWKLVNAFDDAAQVAEDRRVAYAAMILIMTSFIKTSDADPADIISDFYNRLVAGIHAEREKPQ